MSSHSKIIPNTTQAIHNKPNKTTRGHFPIVGIGASAGGLAAFASFFSSLPKDRLPNMAFVLIQHLAPDHSSLLTELVQRYTTLPVVEITDSLLVEINSIYIIPPDRDINFIKGHLHVLQPLAQRGHRRPIDFFFKSLAQDQHEKAIGIILSGTGSDGSVGAETIKGEGGLLMAQSLETAEFNGMPSSIINTGLVDYILAPQDMPAQLVKVAEHLAQQYFTPTPRTELNSAAALKQIIKLLRTETQHDFSLYKPNTIYRRIERRMSMQAIDSIAHYIHFLQQNSEELRALFNDLLIGVTHFFRDTDAFNALEQDIIPSLFQNKASGEALRIWVPACSTGEEAYSIAILCQEYLDTHKQSHKIQIFATDINPIALTKARTGIYPANISYDLTEERLQQFFSVDPDNYGYRINKNLRDHVIFSEHSVIKDPPFSKLDLISCRNLLIYMTLELQKRLIPLFHYALNPGGILFLGSSESIGEFEYLFDTLNRFIKVYQSKKIPKKYPLKYFGDYLIPTPSSHKLHSLIPQLSDYKTMSPTDIPKPTLPPAIISPEQLLNDNHEIDARISTLEQELKLKNDYTQAVQEELEITNEELRCSIEEMHSVNEELQSTNEELETSKEEAQCINEELNIVNAELQSRISDLSKANNDMNNLLAGTGIATIFLDKDLCILRFTPTACEVMNLIPSDIGRPVSHLALNLVNYQHLITDINSVLDTLIVKSIEICTLQNKWLRMQIQPYRTLNNIIEGVVITFTDITEIVDLRATVAHLQAELNHA